MTTAKIDWLTFRYRSHPQVVMRTLEEAFGSTQQVDLVDPRAGRRGYTHGWSIAAGGMVVGQVDSGGDHQRGWTTVQMPGRGCEWVKDWDVAQRAMSELPEWEVRRCDIAVDTYRGEVTHDRVVEGHTAGKFTTRGRNPDMRRIEGWPRENGWTCEVGKRASAKFFRGYEKGYEQANKYSTDGAIPDSIDGVPVRDWYRCELELKAVEGALPLDLIDRRDEYFAGSYPFCRSLIEADPFQLSMPRERRPQNDLSAYLAGIQHQYGRGLFTALVAYEGDISAVWSKIVGREHSRALVEAGVLLVAHD